MRTAYSLKGEILPNEAQTFFFPQIPHQNFLEQSFSPN